MTAAAFYKKNIDQLTARLKKQLQTKNLLAYLRLGTIAAIIGVFYFIGATAWMVTLITVGVLLIVFAQLVYKDIANKEAISLTKELISINATELKALQHHYFQFADGAAHMLKEHHYANDLDIFGHASLFQFVNRTVSEMGSAQLAQWLLNASDASSILQRQEAVKELGKKTNWIQHLQALGKLNPIKLSTRNRLDHWLEETAGFSNFKHWQWLRYFLPLISTGITLATIFGYVPMNIFYITMVFMALVAFPQEKKIGHLHNRLSKMVDELQTLSVSIACIEGEAFTAPLLQSLQKNYTQQQGKASAQIKQLRKILDRLDLRFNIVLYLPLNLLLLWNLQQALDLEKWKKQNDANVGNWFNTLGIIEALYSFAVLHFNHPAWAFPVLKETHFSIEATAMGHPLIAEEKRVNNVIDIKNKAAVMLVTGSNMAGKSTYLRSTGINVVLAMAGAPVCAASFALSPVQLMSSMRIADNLEESTSTFYAELKKLKTIISKVNEHAPVFILLDEILRGTNSFDRHTGSEALIKQLIKQEAVAIIATHDVALSTLEKDFPNHIDNYHFDVQVNNEELFFDYALKPGVCTSLNASILMKKIGIEL